MIWLGLYVLVGVVAFIWTQIDLHKSDVIWRHKIGLSPPSFSIRKFDSSVVIGVLWPPVLIYIGCAAILGPIVHKLANRYNAHLIKKLEEGKDTPEL